jgi:DNA-binding response OmpR family regulator
MPARQADWESTRSPTPLTARQQTVLKRVCDGWTSKQIARSLKCTEGSVKGTLQQLFRKLGVRKRALIARMASEAIVRKLYDSERSGLPAGAVANLSPQPPDSREIVTKAISRIELSEKPVIHAGDFVIDVLKHRAWVRGAEVPFSPTEFKLLAFFSEHPEELVMHESLLGLISGNPAAARESLRVLIHALRAKIETTEAPRYIVNQRNLGYRFVPSPFIGS